MIQNLKELLAKASPSSSRRKQSQSPEKGRREAEERAGKDGFHSVPNGLKKEWDGVESVLTVPRQARTRLEDTPAQRSQSLLTSAPTSFQAGSAKHCPSPLPVRWAILLALAAVAAFHLAYAFAACSFLMVVYLAALFTLSRLGTSRQAFYWGLAIGAVAYAPHLCFFWRIFGPGAVTLWLVLAFWIAIFLVLTRACRVQMGVFWAAALAPFLWTGLECYDLSYARVIDRLVSLGAQALVVPTMDVAEWGAHQHRLNARVAPMRAAEYGLPIFRVASSGISQLVDECGRVRASAPFPGEGAVLAGELPLVKASRLPIDRWLAPPSAALTGLLIICLSLPGFSQFPKRWSPFPKPLSAIQAI